MKTRTLIWVIIVLGILLAGFLFIQGTKNKSNKSASVTFEKLDQDLPNRETMGTIVIRNEKEWMDITGVASTIDFTKNTALLMSMGQRMTGGYSIEVKSIIQNGKKLLANVDFVSPGKNCLSIQVITYPQLVVLIPKTNQEVEWKITNTVQDCPQ